MTRERFFEILESNNVHIDDDQNKEWFWSTRPKWVNEAGAEIRFSRMLLDLIDTAFDFNVSKAGIIAKPSSYAH